MKADPTFVSLVGAVVHCQMAAFRNETLCPPTVGSGSHWWLTGDDFSRSWPRLMRVALLKLAPLPGRSLQSQTSSWGATKDRRSCLSWEEPGARAPQPADVYVVMHHNTTFLCRCCFLDPLSRCCPQTYTPINCRLYVSIPESVFREVWPMMAFWNAY